LAEGRVYAFIWLKNGRFALLVENLWKSCGERLWKTLGRWGLWKDYERIEENYSFCGHKHVFAVPKGKTRFFLGIFGAFTGVFGGCILVLCRAGRAESSPAVRNFLTEEVA